VIADNTPRRSGHGPRLSLVGNSTWSQGNDGSPVRRIESPRRIRGKRRVSRSRAQSIGSSPPSRHSFRAPINPPTSLISIDGSIAPSVPQLPAHALALKSPFARKVSPDIARRAELITHTKPLKPAGHTPTRRRLHQPVVASSSRQSDDEVGDRSQSSQSGSASGSDMSSLCRLERELGTTVRRRGKEIDTLITTLSQTRKENTTLRSEVDHRHAVLDDMLEERQEMKDEIRELRLKLARAERESRSSASSPVRAFGSVRSERSTFRGKSTRSRSRTTLTMTDSPESRRPSLARIVVDHDRSRSSSTQGDIESLASRYSPETPSRRHTHIARSPIHRRISSARSDLSAATSAGISIQASPSRR
jgi:hypothetical protein